MPLAGRKNRNSFILLLVLSEAVLVLVLERTVMNEAIFDHEKLDASLSTSTKKSQNQAMHLLVDSLTAPLDLRLRLTTNGSDCHELDITLKITAKDVRSSAKLTTDMFVRNHNVIG